MGDDQGSASDRSSTSERPCPYEGLSWVDPKVFFKLSEKLLKMVAAPFKTYV